MADAPLRGKTVLLAVSAAIALIICLFAQVACWHDSITFTLYAQFLTEPLSRLIISNRDPAYPFLIWLTGYAQSHTLWNLLIVQTVMAALTPLMVCWIMEAVSLRTGLVMGWISVFTLIPFVFETQIFSDELHVFLLLALVLATFRCCLSLRARPLYAMVILTGLMGFCRPTYWLLVPVTLVMLWRWARRRRAAGMRYNVVHGAVCLILLVDMFMGNIWVRNLPNAMLAERNYPTIRLSSAGHQLMQNVYRYGGGVREAYSDSDGPATREFVRRSVLAFAQCPARFHQYASCEGGAVITKLLAQHRLEQATQTAEATFRTFFYYPRYLGWSFYSDVLANSYWDSNEDDALLARVYFEQITHHPVILAHMVETGLSELVFASYYHYSLADDYGYEPFNDDGRKVPSVPFMPVQRIENCPDQPELGVYADYRFISPGFSAGAQRLFEWIYLPVAIITGLLFLLGACWYGGGRRRAEDNEKTLFFVLFAMYWLPNSVMIMMVMMQFRYQAATALLPLMGAGMFVRRLWLAHAVK